MPRNWAEDCAAIGPKSKLWMRWLRIAARNPDNAGGLIVIIDEMGKLP